MSKKGSSDGPLFVLGLSFLRLSAFLWFCCFRFLGFTGLVVCSCCGIEACVVSGGRSGRISCSSMLLLVIKCR